MTKKRLKEIKDKAERSHPYVLSHSRHDIFELLREIEQQNNRIQELKESLKWYLDRDPTNGATYKIDKEWLNGKRRALKVLRKKK